MNHYTSLEQSKKLVELGLDPETADMSYQNTMGESSKEYFWEAMLGPHPAIRMNTFSFRNGYVLPCWTIGGLLEVMPITIKPEEKVESCNLEIFKGLSGDYFVRYMGETPVDIYASFHGTAINAAYEMVVWLLENGYL